MYEPVPSSSSDPLVRRFDDRGANLVEYALLIALMVLACLGAVTYFADESTDMFTSVCEEIGAATSDSECEE